MDFTKRLLLLAVLVGACGDESDPVLTGEGSGTLRVVAAIEASPLGGEQAPDAATMETVFAIDVRDDRDDFVDDATVVVDSELGPVTLERGGGCGFRYCGVQAGYAVAYDISVQSGADVLDTVHFTGPSWHKLSAPVSGAVIDAAVALAIAWSPADEADETAIETREYDTVIGKDPGAFDLPPDVLRIRTDREEDERVRVARSMRLDLTGGLPGSSLTIRVRNGVSFFTARVVQLP